MKETKAKVLMKRKTVLAIILVLGMTLMLIVVLLQNKKTEEIANIGNVSNNNVVLEDDLIDKLSIEVIDVTKNSKSYVINEDNNYYEVVKDGKYGVIDGDGNVVVDAKYNHLEIINNNLLYVDNKKIIDFSDKHIGDSFAFMYEGIYHDRFIFYVGKLKGVKDEKGNVIIPAKFIEVDLLGEVILAKEENSYTLYDYNGNMIINNLSHFLTGDCINEDLKLDELYDSYGVRTMYWECNSSMAIVGVNNKRGIYFFETKKLIQPEYNSVKYYRDEIDESSFIVYVKCFDKENNLVKLYDENGNEIPLSVYNSDSFEEYIKKQYEEQKTYNSYDTIENKKELVVVKENNKYGLKSNAMDKQLLSYIYDNIEIKKYKNNYADNNEGEYIEAKLNGEVKLFHIDSDLNVKEFNFGNNVEIVEMVDFNNIIVKKDGKMAYVCNQAYITDFIYDNIYISEYLNWETGIYKPRHYIGVVIDNKFGIIDRNGNVILEPYDNEKEISSLSFCVGKWQFYYGDTSGMGVDWRYIIYGE